MFLRISDYVGLANSVSHVVIDNKFVDQYSLSFQLRQASFHIMSVLKILITRLQNPIPFMTVVFLVTGCQENCPVHVITVGAVVRRLCAYPDRKVHGANMGPIWGRQDPGGPHVGPMNFVIWVFTITRLTSVAYVSNRRSRFIDLPMSSQ